MQSRLIYSLVVVTLLTAAGVGFTWNAASAAKNAEPVIGTAGNIAKWVTSTELGDSVIVEDDNGYVAIGTTPDLNFAKFWVLGTFDAPTSSIRGQNYGTGPAIKGVSALGTGIVGSGIVGVSGSTSSNSPIAAGVRGISTGRSFAGDFMGNVRVTGMLTKGGGSFRIDHPLDPKNKFLSHSFVESPDMMNIYNGNAVTNENGEAAIVLPDYFEALNRDFRYQLTPVGQFAQAMVLAEVKNNRFRIKTDKPAVKISWQVTGIRKDKFAEEHRIQVESEKSAGERGTLQNP
ncbi:MAG: hypothetical protein ABIU09_11155 [Pyrinomonadaceae bacterium]